jgi:3-oxoacyl-[acyl-carrier protein] reductase
LISLSGKTALVTGAGRGIGRAIALALANAGADIGVNSYSEKNTRQTAEEIRALGRRAVELPANVADAQSVKTMVAACLEQLGSIDILINNAGITRDGLLMRMKDEEWDEVLDVNLKSAFLCCREVARPMMKARSGKIINITSVVGLMGNAGQANYASSKAGLIGLTKSLAREFASRNVNVNAIAPGFIDTDMTAVLPESEKVKLTERIPLQRLGTPQQIADAVLFLASPLSDYVTGQVLTVDGGLVM